MTPRALREGDDRDFAGRVVRLLEQEPAIRKVRLVGSRAEGRARPMSDWDFLVDTHDFERAAARLPERVRALSPLGTFWDPYSPYWAYIALLPGPRKVDFVFSHPHTPGPAYVARRATLRPMDVHFWDWTVWLASKEGGPQAEIVTGELRKMHELLLGPLGVPLAPPTIAAAVRAYRAARGAAERRFRTRGDRHLTTECLRYLRRAGYPV